MYGASMEKLLPKIEKTDSCWNWKGYVNEHGYGNVTFERKKYMAHRLVFMLSGKVIPDGLCLDHLCRNTRCVNPDHLEAVTLTENIRRALPFRVKKTHCLQGHEFSKENTFFIVLKEGKEIDRRCKKCLVVFNRRAYLKRKGRI